MTKIKIFGNFRKLKFPTTPILPLKIDITRYLKICHFWKIIKKLYHLPTFFKESTKGSDSEVVISSTLLIIHHLDLNTFLFIMSICFSSYLIVSNCGYWNYFWIFAGKHTTFWMKANGIFEKKHLLPQLKKDYFFEGMGDVFLVSFWGHFLAFML